MFFPFFFSKLFDSFLLSPLILPLLYLISCSSYSPICSSLLLSFLLSAHLFIFSSPLLSLIYSSLLFPLIYFLYSHLFITSFLSFCHFYLLSLLSSSPHPPICSFPPPLLIPSYFIFSFCLLLISSHFHEHMHSSHLILLSFH